LRGRGGGAAGGGEFTEEIGTAEAAGRRVSVRIAEAAGIGRGGLGAAATVGERVAAKGKGGSEGPFVGHGESITKVMDMDK
jgi:hypothetical protein